ncbi:hypothetical protein DL766_002974 [Monosporascus sp. MC13-8B]|uniref:ATPase AAA-type core domain-containing protein n=1 Tax=Monosporascus cannonballus TaxID=155416 RepID=A0ABY0HHR9_9PEZI|nr:hypothetical protein DL762_000941 [Monosporascus cannonballus]RYP34453.1 hypothetical protein DL766_002974 [Monosporascus sp. MC13-8B]
MLLQGSVGVGKSLTAESVAEEIKCPLYAATNPGELGIRPGLRVTHPSDDLLSTMNATSRHKIWQNSIQGPDDAVSDWTEPAITIGNVKDLARVGLKGHEIKNAVKTARLFAAKEDHGHFKGDTN